ncbi:hypothetical protein ASG49_17730 [Marmoricola sp. Leaf446]|uniref:hypothetical protein n=1 Tax=Marmoricola sp. Leaf446 TaxID=1736379 RepID=UPI0006F7CF62|nr:hypothetical protein [Marmoricola sp. Leaf446]KQT89566.1 hypothetical protein ASG49_17730 [Marmoricola sp. Leaf446]
MTRIHPRRLLGAATALVLTAGLAACGGSGTEAGAAPEGKPEAESASPSPRVLDPDDDLLQRPILAKEFPGTGLDAQWRFPEGYTTSPDLRMASLSADGLEVTMGVGLIGDKVQQEAYQDMLDEIEADAPPEADYQPAEVEVGDLTWSTVTGGDDDSTLVVYLASPEGLDVTYQLVWQASAAPDDVPDRRTEEFEQFVGSFTLEPAEDGITSSTG